MKKYLMDNFKNKKCAVLGFGRSNKPLVELLLEAGAYVTVHDKNTSISEDSYACELRKKGVSFFLGADHLKNLGGDYIFRSPGFRHDLPEIAAAVKNGAVLTSEMELFFSVCPCPILGVTGSDGKTTTTTLIYLFLDAELKKRGVGRAYVGGNIGASLLPLANQMTKNDFAVVELSSFQLQTMDRSPQRAIITNITPNHLNWHTDMDEYITAKCNICRHNSDGVLITNAENSITKEIAKNSDLPIIYFSSVKNSYEDIVPFFKDNCQAVYEDGGVIYLADRNSKEAILKVSDILLPGRHNIENYMAAIAMTLGLVSNETVSEVARSFGGVEHRLELVRELRGVRYYNSSIDSSPTRTAAALSALPKAPIIICGGSDKNIPFDGLAEDLCTGVKAVVLTGESAPKIMNAVNECEQRGFKKPRIEFVPNFRDAVMAASDMATNGDIVLLSPACASFDAFKNFEERGNFFKTIVNEIE